jgi:hypothetical protein
MVPLRVVFLTSFLNSLCNTENKHIFYDHREGFPYTDKREKIQMINDEEFRQAFATAERYERYKLVRTTGFIILIIGIGRFLLSWIIDQTFLHSLNLEVRVVIVFRLVVQIFLFLTLVLTLVYTYISTKKTSIGQGGNIISVVDIQFGLAICILIYLTFFLQIIASVYFEEVIGIFLIYFILKRGIKNDFKELFHLGLVLLVISIIEVGGRIILVFALWNHQVFIPIWTVFYLGIAVIFVIPYLIFGRRIIKSASLILEEV